MYKTIQNTRQLISRVFIILLIFPLFSCSEDPTGNFNSDYHYTQPTETTDSWETATLSSVGINEELIENIVNEIDNNTWRQVHSVVIVKNSLMEGSR